MATFARSTFGYANYAAARPSYSQALYNIILSYHTGSKEHCVDLGTGHGLVARAVAPYFARVIAIDPSQGMLSQASTLTPKESYPNVAFVTGPAEATSTIVGEGGTDMVVSAQAAHWFDYSRLWPDLNKAVRKGGTIAFWGYREPYFPNYPTASKILGRYLTGQVEGRDVPDMPSFAAYWPQPGTGIVQGLYRDILPPDDAWEDVQRIEYHPSFDGPGKGDGTLILTQTLKLRDLEAFTRSFSAVHKWQEAHPERKPRRENGSSAKGDGDIIDMMFDEIRDAEPDWRDPENEVLAEWATGLLLARKK